MLKKAVIFCLATAATVNAVDTNKQCSINADAKIPQAPTAADAARLQALEAKLASLTKSNAELQAAQKNSFQMPAIPSLRGGWWGSSSDDTAKKAENDPTVDSSKQVKAGDAKNEDTLGFEAMKNGNCATFCYLTPFEWCSNSEDKQNKVKTIEAAKEYGVAPDWKPSCCETEKEKTWWDKYVKEKYVNYYELHNYAFWYFLIFGIIGLFFFTCCCCCCKCCRRKKGSISGGGYYYPDE